MPGTSTSAAPPQLWLSAIDPVVQEWTHESGSADYMSLFAPGADWAAVAQQTGVFTITTQFVSGGSDSELQAVFSYLSEHHIALALAGLMLPGPVSGGGIGAGVEGYSAPGTMALVSQRIAALGGSVDYLVMDEPLYYGHEYSGPNAAHASIDEVARQVATSVSEVQAIFPNVRVGDVEPVPGTGQLEQWLAAYKDATGEDLSFFQADVQWGAAWKPALESLSQELKRAGITLGVIYDGDSSATSGAQWDAEAVRRFASVEADPLIDPGQALIETWNPQPTNLLPEGTLGTLTNLALTYLAATPLLRAANPAAGDGTTLSLSAPPMAWGLVGVPELLSTVGIRLAGGPRNVGYLVILAAAGGTITAIQAEGASISGSGSGFVVLSGSFSDVGRAIASASFTPSGTGPAELELAAFDGAGQSADSLISLMSGTFVPLAISGSDGGISAVQAELKVGALYEQVYSRAPDPAGLVSFANALLSGSQSIAAIRTVLATSPETVRNITTAYSGIFGRLPTNRELSSAEAQLTAGQPLDAVEAPWLAIARSKVTQLYLDVQGRQPDEGGLLSFSNDMLHGETAPAIRDEFATSPESASRLSALVQQYAGHAASQAELSGLENWLAAGVSVKYLTSLLAGAGSIAAASEIVDQATVQADPHADTIVATQTEHMQIPVGDTALAYTPAPTVLLLAQPGAYDFSQPAAVTGTDSGENASSLQYADLPDGTPFLLSGATIVVLERPGAAPTTVKIPAALASNITVIGSGGGSQAMLEIAGVLAGPIILNSADTGIIVKLDEPENSSSVGLENAPITFLSYEPAAGLTASIAPQRPSLWPTSITVSPAEAAPVAATPGAISMPDNGALATPILGHAPSDVVQFFPASKGGVDIAFTPS